MGYGENNNVPMTMLVGPAGYNGGYGYNGGFGGFGGFGDGGWWIILLLLCLGGGMWGGFGGGMWPMMMGGGEWGLYPWLNNSQNINDGFRTQQLSSDVGALRSDVNRGFGDVAMQLCSGFGGVNARISDAAAQAEISANGRQMSNMQQLFGIQTGLGDLKYTVATENCADRQVVSDGVKDIIANQTAGIQRVLDKLCALEIDNVKAQYAAEQRENANLRTELMYARGQASQVEQTARILAGQSAEIDGIYNRLRDCPVNTVPVYGNQRIFQCSGGNSCGCGCGNSGF